MIKTNLSLGRSHVELASFELHHEYYSSKKIPKIEFVPTLETASFFRNYKIIVKKINSKIILLQEGWHVAGQWKPKIAIESEKRVSFAIKLNDELFQLKTNVPLHATKGQKFFLCHNESNATKIDELKIFPFFSGAFPVNLFEGKEVVRVLNSELKIADSNSLNSFLIAQDFNVGRYKIEYQDGAEYTFIWSPKDNNYDGFVSLNITQQLEQLHQVTLSSREIFWEYILNAKYFEGVEHCTITDDQQKLSFEVFEAGNQKENQFSLISSISVGLKEHYKFRLSLEAQGEILLGLPYPSLSHFSIKREGVKNPVNNYFLTMIVNI